MKGESVIGKSVIGRRIDDLCDALRKSVELNEAAKEYACSELIALNRYIYDVIRNDYVPRSDYDESCRSYKFTNDLNNITIDKLRSMNDDLTKDCEDLKTRIKELEKDMVSEEVKQLRDTNQSLRLQVDEAKRSEEMISTLHSQDEKKLKEVLTENEKLSAYATNLQGCIKRLHEVALFTMGEGLKKD